LKKNFRSSNEAKKFARSLRLKSKTEWEMYLKYGKRPDDIPYDPRTVYKKEWKGWGDWLGTGSMSVQNIHKQFRSFDEAKKFVHKLGLKNQKEWREYLKSGKRPADIPANPDGTYKKEWKNMGDWLGTGYVANSKREYRTFKDAKRFACRQGLKGQSEWVEYAKKNKKLLEKLKIPAHPAGFYKNEFLGYGDWLGTGNIQNNQRIFWPFEKARRFARKLGLKTLIEWKQYCKSGKLPKSIPTNPNRTYKKEWKSTGDWLGNDKITNQEKSKNFLPYRKAHPIFRELKKKYGLKNRNDWTRFVRMNKILVEKLQIPTEPWAVYTKEKVWKRMKK